MGDTAEESHKAVPQSLRFIMIVLVQVRPYRSPFPPLPGYSSLKLGGYVKQYFCIQDSLELAEKINTRVHKWLLQQQEFQ